MKSEKKHLGLAFYGRLATTILSITLTILFSHGKADAADTPDKNDMKGSKVEQKIRIILSGKVYDYESRKEVSEARVFIKNLDAGYEFISVTDKNGYYEKKYLEPGNYYLCIRKKGYFSPHHSALIDESTSYFEDKETRRQVIDFSMAEKTDHRLTGVISDEKGYHVPRAKVEMKGFDRSLMTDEYGTYMIDDVPEDLKSIVISRQGFVQETFHLLDLNYFKESFNPVMKKLATPVAVGPKGYVFKQYPGTTITIPEGALDEIVEISITQIPTEFTKPNHDGIPVPNSSAHFDFKPAGLQFKKPVTVVTPSIVPEKFLPDKDTRGTLVLLNDKTGKSEEIEAFYHHKDRTVEYKLWHFSRLVPNNALRAEYKGVSKRVETIREKVSFDKCYPRGCVDCVEMAFYTDWGIRESATTPLNFNAVRIKGVLVEKADSCDLCSRGELSFMKKCDADQCRMVELWIGSHAEFEIDSFFCNPWFAKKEGLHVYVTRMKYEKPEAQCRQGGPCGEGQVCRDNPSECCQTVCSDGRCSKNIPVPILPECKRCSPDGQCIPDNNLPCSDGDPCTINDRCVGGKCIGVRIPSKTDPNCP